MLRDGKLRKLRRHSRFAETVKRRFAAWCVFVMLFSTLDLSSFQIAAAETKGGSSQVVSNTLQVTPTLLSGNKSEESGESAFLYTDQGSYAEITISGSHKKNQVPTASRNDGISGAAEAWTVSNIKNNTSLTVRAEITAVPEDGTLFVYSVRDNELEELVASNLSEEDMVEFDLSMKGSTGIAIVVAKSETEEDIPLVEGALYANEHLYLTGKIPGNGIIDAQPVNVEIAGEKVLAAYDIKIYANANQQKKGKTWQPAGKKVQVHFFDEGFEGDLNVYHLDGTEPELVTSVQADDGWVVFEAEHFSTYAVTRSIEQTVEIGGNTYHVTVTYDHRAGIPEGATLLVSELKPGNEKYDEYVAAGAAKVGTRPESIELSRIFDIQIVDENDHSIVYEPACDVEVSIRLIGETLETYANLNVLHFVEKENTDGFTAYDMNSIVNGETVQFTTDSFSVYAVIGSVHVRTYYFYTFDEYLDYVPYYLNTDIGTEEGQTYMQIVREGETPVAPQNPVNPQDQEATFSGWYAGSANTADGPTDTVPYTFGAVSDLTEDETVYLYAKFSRYIYVIFHDQHDAGSDSFPVAFTRRLDLSSEQESDWYVDVAQYSVTYQDPNELDNTAMVFVGWSEAPITTPGALLNDDGDMVTEVATVQTNNGEKRLFATETTHLYPIFASVRWISFYSGPSGSHATYFTDTYYLDGVGPETLPGSSVMTRDGNWEFEGWYVNASLDGSGETVITGADCVKVAHADGSLNTDASAEDMAKLSAAGINFENIAVGEESTVYRIKLTGNVALYAHWIARTTANYTVVIFKQNATDAEDEDESNNTYSYAESFILSGDINEVLYASDSRFENYQALNTYAGYNALHNTELTEANNETDNPYANYEFSTGRSDPSVTVSADGSSILCLRYNWITKPTVSSSDRFALRFIDPMADYVYAVYELIAVEGAQPVDQRIAYGSDLSEYVPNDTPVSTVSAAGLTFNGWYADHACTTRAIFHAGSSAADLTDEEKASLEIRENNVVTGYRPFAFFATMPAADMTFYAGWTKEWFLIKIDPNYGELYKHVYTDDTQTNYVMEEDETTHKQVPKFTGTGSTWMWKEYGDTFQEYTTVRRDFVESDSGSWYFVNHDRAYHGYPDTWVSGESGERKTYYTKDLSEATEFTTFEYQEGVYRYAGWYEVFEDGTEADTRYDFSRIVDHNITLRLRWQKVGAYYLQYDAGLGTLNHDEENEVLYLELDDDSYNDDADVLITRTATAPSGYEFVGWRIRHDESETIYRAGETFHLLSRFMATVQGKHTVFLDAVYEQVPTATIVYHANGGTVASGITASNIHYGSYPIESGLNNTTLVTSADLTENGESNWEPTATVAHIVNNSIFALSDGAWLERTGATFAGWCENSVFNPDDEEHPILKTDGSEEYRVGANTGETVEEQTVHLYAIWQVDVKYHLNADPSNATFGPMWDSLVYTLNAAGDTYTQPVYVGSNLTWPPYDPVWTGSAGTSFWGWADSDIASSPDYDFSQPVTGALDLYALWDSAPVLEVLVVDSSDYPTIDYAPWVVNEGTADGRTEITVTSEHQTPAALASAITTGAETYNSNHSTTYAFSYATILGIAEDMQHIQEKRIDQVYYSPQDSSTHLIYNLGTADERDVALGDDEKLCFVYYQVKTPPIGYLLMEDSGNVKVITSSMSNDAPVSTAALVGSMDADTSFAIGGSYQPMSWLPSRLTEAVSNTDITHYNFAIGSPDATSINQLDHMTEAYTSDSTRPDMYIKNTWQGIRFSQDGTDWFSAGADPMLYVVFYTEMPTVVTLYNKTIGLPADMETRFAYDYWIEKIPLTDDSPNYAEAELIYTTRNPGMATSGTIPDTHTRYLSGGETFSAFTYTSSTHTYRVTVVLKPEADSAFKVTMPTTVLDPATMQPLSGSNPATALPSWVTNETRDFVYQYENTDREYTFSYTVLANDGYCGKTAVIPFINTRSTVNVDLHVAKAELNGNIYHAPEWRVEKASGAASAVQDEHNAYTVQLALGETKNLFEDYTYDQFTRNVDVNYKLGALIYGQDRHTSYTHSGASGDNDMITLDDNASLDCYRLSYELVDSSNPNVYDLYLRDGSNSYRYPLAKMSEQIARNINGVTHPDDGTMFYRLFYLFYPAVTVYYVRENADGTLTPVVGSISGTITYNGAQATMNSQYDGIHSSLNTEIVRQGQKVGIWTQSLEISQKVGNDENGNPIFNIPPLLDNGTHPLDLIYYKMGARPQDDPSVCATNIRELDLLSDPSTGVTETLKLEIGIMNHRLQWQFEDEDVPHVLGGYPVVYAIYRERGYNLTVTKTVTTDTGYAEPYTVTITSPSINRDKYTVTGTGYSTISAVPAQLDASSNLMDDTGKIAFEVRDGDSITIYGLIPGSYTVVETGNENDILSAATVPALEPAVTVTDNSTVSFALDANMELQLTNDPKWICRYGSVKFRTLSSAVEYISAHSSTMSGTIEMLTDYLMPASDTPVIPSYLNISLTTANDYSGSGSTATITRKGNVITPMISNLGTFTLGNVILDGNNVSGSALISNEGTLTLGGSISVTNLKATTRMENGVEVITTTATTSAQANTSPVLQNAAGSGNGGAIYSRKGAVNVVGGTIESCSATNGGAIYAEAGTVKISGGTMQNNSAANGGAIYYAGSDTLTVSGGTIGAEDYPNIATNGGAIYMASGTADITGGTINYNTASESGGAIYALNAYVNVNGNSATIDRNTATIDGGAVHMETLTFKLMKGNITNNSAGNGGAIWAGTGTVELSGGSVSNNTATTGSGGAVYTQSSAFSMTGGTLSDNKANENGGGVYTESGSVTARGTNTQIRNNETTTGSGGGIYAESGAVTVNGNAKLYGNTATSGNGGALYIGSGAASLSSAIIGSTDSGNGNQAINGSGVFVNTGTLSVTDGSISGNQASNGGAVGFGSEEARLNLYNTVNIKDNTMEDSPSNVYLNFDTDTIINFQTLSGDNNTYVGIYVSDDEVTVNGEPSTVQEQRGVPNARFGVYVNNNVVSNLGKIHNDRTPNLTVRQETTNKKLYWVRDFNVKIYYVADYSKGLPFGPTDYTSVFTNSGLNGSSFKKELSETPPEYNSAASEVAADLRTKDGVNLPATSVFGNAFVKPDSGELTDVSYSDYLTDINWNSTPHLWEYVKRDGSNVDGGADPNAKKTLIFIYTEPYYLSIENNARDDSNHGLTLNISSLAVTVNGTSQNVIDNYGYLYAKNDEIQNELKPVQASDLVLEYGESIRILLPGGKNMAYSLTGTYYSSYDGENTESSVPATGTVTYRQRLDSDSTNVTTGSVNADSVSVSGATPNVAGRTYELIFGGDRAICKVVVSSRISDTGTESRYIESGFVDEHTGDGATDGKYEYTFTSPKQAYDFIKAHSDAFTSGSAVTAAIEMLMDYMIPASEQVSLTTGGGLTYDITFQTAVDGYFRYDPDHTNDTGTGDKPRATISRASGNLNSFIAAPNGTLNADDYVDTLKVKNLVFDGKSFGGKNIAHGIIDTNGWNVEIDHCDFNNCQAKYGGGIFIKSVTPNTGVPYGHLTVTNSSFNNCQSLESQQDKYGGGAIWTSMKTLTVEHCDFTSCYCARQGGAVFHFVDTQNDRESYTTINNCTFEGCSAGQAAGSMETGAKVVYVTNTTFRNSTSNLKNGGALNIWAGNSDKQNGQPTTDCWVYLTGCTFENCYALNGTGTNDGNGGAMRSTAKYNTITECTFINNIGNNGGAINIYNGNAEDTVISGCKFSGCSARGQGGAIWCRSKTLTIKGSENTANSFIRNCTAPKEGGGVYHAKNVTGSVLTVKDTTIDTCTSTTKAGGGVYSTALTAFFTGCIVQNCSTVAANQNGGGVYLTSGSTTLDGTTIRNCTATGLGGGVYQNGGSNVSFTVMNDSLIDGNVAQGSDNITCDSITYQVSGGGIYANAKTFTLQNSSVTDNQSAASGGGICHRYSDGSGMMIIDGATVTGNISGGYGGGLFTLTNMTMKGITAVTGNRLTSDSTTANNAAGVYLRNSVTLSLGETGGTAAQHKFDITGNLTVDGTLSDLRLPDRKVSNEIVNANNVKVYCDIDGEIRVVNANKKLTQFGTAQGTLVNPAGFTDEHKVFWADDGSLYGIVDRQDTNGQKIIWGGDPVCKITDGNGRLLYIKLDDNHYRPAVFDRLDSGNTNDTSSTSAFSTLRGTDPLYYVNGEAYTGSDYQVKMLVENYTAEYFITATGGTERNVTLTTARTTDSLYAYRGREGTRSTILRDPRMNTSYALVTAKTNLNLSNIVLDGGSENGVKENRNTRVITADAAIQITLDRNATLQNAVCTGNGGGVYLNNGAKFAITGGTIRNCSAVNGGAVYIDGAAGTFTMSVGTITGCTASENGGGVYFNKGTLTNDGNGNPISGFMLITGGSITRCTAKNGGGVYLNSGSKGGADKLTRHLYMSGGSIASNYAAQKGGGIFVGDGNVRIYFSGAPYVNGSTSGVSVSDDHACNLEMDQTFTRTASNPGTVIVSSGLGRGAKIGVYVPGADSGRAAGVSGASDSDTLYDKHGAEMDPFATFTDSRGLNYFLNDRNGMKGGQLDNPDGSDYKIYWRIIYALSVKKQVLSDDPSDMTTYRFRLTLMGEITNANQTKTSANEINGTYGDLTFTNGVATFALTNGQTKAADLLPLGFDYKVEELLDSAQAAYFHTSVENWNHTVSTGTEVTGEMKTQNHFNYIVTFSNLHAICKITDEQGRLLYIHNSTKDTYVPAVYSSLVTAFNRVNAGNENHWLRLGDDGRYYEDDPSSYQIQMLVPECEMEGAASLMNGRIALLTTADRNAEDGFPYVGGNTTAKITRDYTGESMITVSNGSLTLGNITLDGNGTNHPVSCNGDILYVTSGSSLTVGTGARLQNAVTSGNGAAVHLAQGAIMNISGAPVFTGNVKTGARLGSNPKNGDDPSFYSGTTAPQDIYLAGYNGTIAGSIVVTGNITSEHGSIAVWAAENPHYIQNQQFAVMSGGNWNGLDAFRNARPDSETKNPLKNAEGTPKYLYGVAREDKVFWSGSVELTVSKTVTGEMADLTASFEFTVSFTGLEDGYECDSAIYHTDNGTDWTMVGTATKLTVAEEKISFSLTHHQKIIINVPSGVTVIVSETNPGYGEVSYEVTGGSAEAGTTIAMNADTAVAFTNNFAAVAPTDFSVNYVPYLLMAAAGIVLALMVTIGRRKRREEE